MNTTCNLTKWGFDVEAHIEFRQEPNGEIDILSVQIDGYEVDELTDKQWAQVEGACRDEIFERAAKANAQ